MKHLILALLMAFLAGEAGAQDAFTVKSKPVIAVYNQGYKKIRVTNNDVDATNHYFCLDCSNSWKVKYYAGQVQKRKYDHRYVFEATPDPNDRFFYVMKLRYTDNREALGFEGKPMRIHVDHLPVADVPSLYDFLDELDREVQQLRKENRQSGSR